MVFDLNNYPKLKRICIGDAIEGKLRAKGNDFVVINVAEPIENRYADIFYPLVFLFGAQDKIEIPMVRLDGAASIIDGLLNNGYKCYLHCSAGLERSPLVVTWWVHRQYNMSLKNAFELVLQIRTQALDRTAWIKYDTYEDFLYHTKE